MPGDPSRRPSDQRVLAAAIDAPVWVECASCFGDGWHWPYRGRATRKITCNHCGGVGRRRIAALELRPQDRLVEPP